MHSWICHAVLLRDLAAMGKQAIHDNSTLMGKPAYPRQLDAGNGGGAGVVLENPYS